MGVKVSLVNLPAPDITLGVSALANKIPVKPDAVKLYRNMNLNKCFQEVTETLRKLIIYTDYQLSQETTPIFHELLRDKTVDK